MRKARPTLTEQEIINIITCIEWGLTDYDDEKHVEQLEKLHKKMKVILNRAK